MHCEYGFGGNWEAFLITRIPEGGIAQSDFVMMLLDTFSWVVLGVVVLTQVMI